MPNKYTLEYQTESPWMVTQVSAQLDAMAGACNELYKANRTIVFIVPINQPSANDYERPTSHIAIFTVPRD